jgi:hypothetical protein
VPPYNYIIKREREREQRGTSAALTSGSEFGGGENKFVRHLRKGIGDFLAGES